MWGGRGIEGGVGRVVEEGGVGWYRGRRFRMVEGGRCGMVQGGGVGWYREEVWDGTGRRCGVV